MNPLLLAAAAAAAVIVAGKLVYDYLYAEKATKDITSTPKKKSVADCPLKKGYITEEEARQLIKDFDGQKDHIPFNYPPDCCYARARVMCDQMEKKGIPCEKFWYGYDSNGVSMEPTLEDGNLVFFPPKPHPNAQQVMWGYHVAPLVPVKQADGSVQKMVIDPSLSDKPLTMDQWKTRAGRVPDPTEITSDSNWVPWGDHKQSVDDAEDALSDHRKARKDGLA